MHQNLVGSRGGSLNFENASLATSTVANSANRVNVANKVAYVIDGKFYAAALVNNQALSSGHTALVNNQVCVFALWADTSAAFSTTQGPIVDSEAVEDGNLAVPLPDVVSTKALIGLIKVKAGVATTFTPGTTAFNATNVNTTYYNTVHMPSTPFASTT
jgi:hypothetical protein